MFLSGSVTDVTRCGLPDAPRHGVLSSMNRWILGSVLAWVAVVATSTARSEGTIERARDGRTTVLWLSIDGFRGDYVDRAPAPFLQDLRSRSWFTNRLRPVFPSLTFPSHVSQSTGVRVADHGIPSNSFFDRERGETERYPGPQALLEAEPIWTTATRQGVRTLVYDWPLSHDQRGEHVAEYFGVRFDGALTDEERLERALVSWDADEGGEPLRLIMAYIVGTDSIGHSHGPDSEEVLQKTREVDAAVKDFVTRAAAIWERNAGEGDELFVFITTDHGMSRVDFNVNAEALLGLPRNNPFEIVTGGNVGHVFFPESASSSERERLTREIRQRLDRVDYVKMFTQDEVPEDWGYTHATRIGDLVLVLDNYHTFNRSRPQIKTPAARGAGPLGMHGYLVEDNEEMKGFMLVARYPEPLPEAVDLGPVDSLSLHPTVARLLGIEPAEGASAVALVNGE